MNYFDLSLKENKKYPSHFRVHYSNKRFVLTLLARTSPYTEEQISFNNNKLFSAYKQINSFDEFLTLLSSQNDNRELIQEYFTTIEFFLNMNYIYFNYQRENKILINDIAYQEKFFNSLGQYIYYQRLILNLKFDISDVNKNWFKERTLHINDWIDLIFGCKQWKNKPKREDLNLFGKYCYNQNINFNEILKKYRTKKYDDIKIINKIESKKFRILYLGQCPEKLFNEEQAYSVLHENQDDLEVFSHFQQWKIEIPNNYNVICFWIIETQEKKDYIYFLSYDKQKYFKGNNSDELYNILIYNNSKFGWENPDYIINIKELNLFPYKSKLEKKNYKNTKTKKKDYNNTKATEYVNYDGYKLSPNNCIFEVCCEQVLYFFVGRNIDNSLKIYEINIDQDKTGKLKYSITMHGMILFLVFIEKIKIFFSPGIKMVKFMNF